jgi:molecular chaperone GrpE
MEAKGGDLMEGEDEPIESIESLKKGLLEEQIKSKELLNRLKYAQADLENYRKRAEKEMADAREASLGGLLGRLLVILDELALAVKHAETEGKDKNLSEGFRMVQKNLEAALESVGVERIDAIGRPFDPAVHEAAEKVTGLEEGEELVVVEELRPGYRFHRQVLRPSLVKVGTAVMQQEEEHGE